MSAENEGGNRARMRVQLVIPCYNEESRFDAQAFGAFLERTRDVGIILVNDGSSDGTLAVLQQLTRRFPNRAVVLDQQPNRGKAEAVRAGMLHAVELGAAYAGYFDADLATPLEASGEFIQLLDEDPQLRLLIGARVGLLGRAIQRKAARHYLGRVFATGASLVLALPVYDTQCGAKLLRIDERTRALFAEPFASRWIFDVELLARYMRIYGGAGGLYEVPLRRWSDIGTSHVRWHDFLRSGAELAAIYRDYGALRDLNMLLRLATAPFLRYVAAGGVGTAFHYLTLTLLVELAHLAPTLATGVGACVGAGVNYFLNYHFTFASRAAHQQTLPRFLTVAAASAGLNVLGMWFAIHALGMHWLLAQLGCSAAVLVFGYLLNRIWTFRQ